MCLSGIPASGGPCDSELSLFAGLAAHSGELFGITRIIQQLAGFQTVNDRLDEPFVFAAAGKCLFHFMDGVSTAHQHLDRRFVKSGFGFELFWFAPHNGKHREAGPEGQWFSKNVRIGPVKGKRLAGR